MRSTKHNKCLTSRVKPRGMALLTDADQTGFLPGAKEAICKLMMQPKLTPEETMATLTNDKNRTAALKFLNSKVNPQTTTTAVDFKLLDKVEGIRQELTNSMAAETKRRKTEALKRERLAQKREDAANARAKAADDRVAALAKALDRKTMADGQALIKLANQKAVITPSPPTHAQTPRGDANTICVHFLRGGCTRLDYTKAHLRLPSEFQAVTRGQNKRSRNDTHNKTRGKCFNFGTPRGCWRGNNCRYQHSHTQDDRRSNNRPKCGDCGAPHQTGSAYCDKKTRQMADRRADAAMQRPSVPAIMPPSARVCQLCKGAHEVPQCPTYLALTKNG
jgi:hypothetical protein